LAGLTIKSAIFVYLNNINIYKKCLTYLIWYYRIFIRETNAERQKDNTMKSIFTLAALLVLTACGSGGAVLNGNPKPTPPPTIGGGGGEQYAPPAPSVPTEAVIAKGFQDKAQAYGLNLNTTNLSFVIVAPVSISPLVTRLDGNTFYISSSAWNALTNNCEKEKFLYRELGRWVLGRSYNNAQSSGTNSSVMNPSGFSCDIYVANYQYFMDELFTQTYRVSFVSNPSSIEITNGQIYFNTLYR
jgi:hypothetical protein